MMYPNPIRQNDNIANVKPLPELKRFTVQYVVTDSSGHQHTGAGVVKSTDLKEAYVYAMRLLRSYTPECAGYCGHAVRINEIETLS